MRSAKYIWQLQGHVHRQQQQLQQQQQQQQLQQQLRVIFSACIPL